MYHQSHLCVFPGADADLCENSGSEFPDDLLENLRTHKIREQGLGIALLNIEERIQLMFGQQYGLHFYNENDFAVVKMEIPYVKDDYRG